MKISIVIPMYNKQNTIRRAIYSVFEQWSQLIDEMQLVIIDDGSTDSSLSVARRIQKENTHHELIIFTQENSGVSAARNAGIKLAKHDLIAFLDADDSYEINFLNEIALLVDKYPSASAYCTGYRFIDTHQGTKRNARLAGLSTITEQQLLKDYFYSAATSDLPITSSSICIRRRVLHKLGGFPIGENMGEDQAVWSQIALKNDIAISKRVCSNYFENTSNSLMQTITPNNEMPFSRRLQKQLDDGEIPSKFMRSVELYIAGHLLDLVRRNLETGNLVAARKLIVDPRSEKQPIRWLLWTLRVYAGDTLNRLKRGLKLRTH